MHLSSLPHQYPKTSEIRNANPTAATEPSLVLELSNSLRRRPTVAWPRASNDIPLGFPLERLIHVCTTPCQQLRGQPQIPRANTYPNHHTWIAKQPHHECGSQSRAIAHGGCNSATRACSNTAMTACTSIQTCSLLQWTAGIRCLFWRAPKLQCQLNHTIPF